MGCVGGETKPAEQIAALDALWMVRLFSGVWKPREAKWAGALLAAAFAPYEVTTR